MVNYKQLGYNSISEYDSDFEETLLTTNHTYEYFVNWDKVFNNINKFSNEIDILNKLTKVNSEEIEACFREIINSNPNVIPILPSIAALRDKNVDILDIDNNDEINIKFSKNSIDTEGIVKFAKHTGLLDLFLKINDLESYLVGVEVGLDTNARKNRSGHTFEDIVGKFLADTIKDYHNFSLKKEDTIAFDRTKRWDYVIYKNEEPKIFFECNFYNSSGSKPIEVANAYVDLQHQINDANYDFIWVTDGQGWKKMSKSLKEVSSGINYIFNFNMLTKHLKKFLV